MHEEHKSAARAGIGMRHPHYAEFDSRRPDVGFVEVHSENFFNRFDAASAVLQRVREAYPVSLHGVGLSLGAAAGVDREHLESLAELVERIEPCRVSDHASFARGSLSDARAVHANDLLPLAFTDAQLAILADNVQRVQDRLRRPLLVENLSSYVGWREADWSEPAFFAELGRRSGCGLLLDVNNLMVNAKNAKAADPLRSVCDWIDELATLAAPGLVGEIHLAGHSEQGDLVVDDHADVVSPPVWMAYAHALHRFGGVPTLIEWDTDLPALDVLLGEAAQAQALLDEHAAGWSPACGATACAA
jgi:uncharacterized protein (UPF0276 family)